MDEKIAYWGSVILSSIALVLIVVNISLSTSNRAVQEDVAQRQNQLAGGQQLSQFNQNLVQIIAEAAYKDNNTQLRDLLASQGISLKSSPTPAAATSPDNPPKPASKPAEKK
jgi:hypothetical protein